MPSSPGVYWFLDENNTVIYVGKAKNLKNRLLSYSRSKGLLPKTKQLINKAKAVKYQILESELEALLVEAELIRLHQPHYNILLKDDKSPLYIVTTKEDYPRVLTIRKSDLVGKKHDIISSFGPFPSGRQVREVLKIARRIFPYCTATPQDKQRHRPCFYVHIGLCPGACVGKISISDYHQNIFHLEQFLRGKQKEVVRSLINNIKVAAEKQDFETALQLKQKVEAIRAVNLQYRLNNNEQILPNLSEDTAAHRVFDLTRILHHHGLKVLKLDRIEGYDVANLQGESAAVSMVVAVNGELNHDEYKHFSIKTLQTPNDVGMLKEALVRRQHHPEWGIPDLIMVDGGRPQLNAVSSIMTWQVPLVGLAKNPDRLLIPVNQHPQTYESIRLDASTPAGGLLISLRDESHRFARRLHHYRHLEKMLNV